MFEIVHSLAALIAALAALVAALVQMIKLVIELSKGRAREEPPRLQDGARRRRAMIVILLLLAASLSILYFRRVTSPKLTITSPLNTVVVNVEGNTGSVWFPVTGTSSNTASRNDLKIYVLLYSATDFHVQKPAALLADGSWTVGKAYIGDASDPVYKGKPLLIVAVASRKQVKEDEKMPTPGALGPDATSQTVKLTVQEIRPVPAPPFPQ